MVSILRDGNREKATSNLNEAGRGKTQVNTHFLKKNILIARQKIIQTTLNNFNNLFFNMIQIVSLIILHFLFC